MKKYKRPKGITLAQIFNKTGGMCAYCGLELDAFAFQVEHVIPQSQGGSSNVSNLVASCEPCNRKKRDRTPEQFREWIPAEIARKARKLYDMLDWACVFYPIPPNIKKELGMLAYQNENDPHEVVFFMDREDDENGP